MFHEIELTTFITKIKYFTKDLFNFKLCVHYLTLEKRAKKFGTPQKIDSYVGVLTPNINMKT